MPLPSMLQSASLAVLLALLPSAASALSAEEVWADWQRLAKEADVELTAIARREGDRLVLTSIVVPVGPPDDLVDVKIGKIELEDQPDGTVAVLLPEKFPVMVETRDDSSEGPDLVTFAAYAPSFEMTIAGVGDTAAFEILAPSLVLSLAEVVPELRIDEQFEVNLAVADLEVRHTMDLTQATETIDFALSLGTLHLDGLVDVDDGSNDRVDVAVDASDLVLVLDAAMPQSVLDAAETPTEATTNPLPEILKAFSVGMSVRAEFSHGAYSIVGDVNENGEETRVEMTSALGKAIANLDALSGGYDLTVGKTAVAVKGNAPELEYSDVSMSFAELAYGVSVGIGDLTSPQEARITARLIDLTIPPEIWAEVDPAGALGASPLSFGMEVKGRYALSPEMLEPGWEPEPDTFPPLDIVELTLTELLISSFGMDISGDGALSFDETDLVTFEGIPAPEGKLSFRATGVNSFIDRVVAAGLFPAEDLTPLRMGLMFIAKAGDAPDSLISEIEFREKSFYLNGMKLR